MHSNVSFTVLGLTWRSCSPTLTPTSDVLDALFVDAEKKLGIFHWMKRISSRLRQGHLHFSASDCALMCIIWKFDQVTFAACLAFTKMTAAAGRHRSIEACARERWLTEDVHVHRSNPMEKDGTMVRKYR